MEDANSHIDARTELPTGAVVRLRTVEVDRGPHGGWQSVVDIVQNGNTTVLCRGNGVEPTKVYNNTIQPFVDEDGEPLVDDDVSFGGGS